MKNGKLLAVIGLITAITFWGLSFLSIKVTVVVLPPMTLGLLRFIVASIFLSVAVKIKEPQTKLNKKDIPLVFSAGFWGVTIYFYFQNNGIKLMPASTASLVIATIPIFALIGESIFFKTKLTRTKMISVLVSFTGVFFIVGSDFHTLTSSQMGKGYLLMFGSVFCWVIYLLVTKPLFGKYSHLGIVYYQTLFGTLCFIPFVWFEKTQWAAVNGMVILNVIYLGLFCSAVAYYIYAYGMERLGVSASALYLNLMPMITVIASVIILHEQVFANQIWGGLLVILSVCLANLEGYKSKINKETEAVEGYLPCYDKAHSNQ